MIWGSGKWWHVGLSKSDLLPPPWAQPPPHDKVATMCDLRLCHGTHLNTAPQDETKEAFATAYADFA